jgi:hypothetical protein
LLVNNKMSSRCDDISNCQFDINKYCPGRAEDPTKLPDNAVEILRALGGDIPCYRDKSVYTSTSKSGSSGGTLVVGGGSSSSTTTVDAKDISIGCEQMTAVINNYKSATDAVSCIVNTSRNIQKTVLTSSQVLNIDCEGDLVINGDISQIANVELITSINLSDEEKKVIDTAIKESVKNSLDLMQNSKTENTLTTGGQKSFAQTNTDIDNKSYNAVINEKINEFNTMLGVGQYVNINGKKNCVINGDITQNVQIKLLATAIVNSVYTTEIKTAFETIYENDTRVVQSAEANESSWTKYIVIGGAVLLVCCILSFLLIFIMKKKDNAPSQFTTPAYQHSYQSPMYTPPYQMYNPQMQQMYYPQQSMNSSPIIPSATK